MKVRYELQIGSQVVHGDIEELYRMAYNTYRPWELYEYRTPKVPTHGKMKLTQHEIGKAVRMHQDGKTFSQIACKLRISKTYAYDVIKAEIKRKIKLNT